MSAISEGRMNTFAAAAAAIFGEGGRGRRKGERGTEQERRGCVWQPRTDGERRGGEAEAALSSIAWQCVRRAWGAIQQFFLRDSADEVIPEHIGIRTNNNIWALKRSNLTKRGSTEITSAKGV